MTRRAIRYDGGRAWYLYTRGKEARVNRSRKPRLPALRLRPSAPVFETFRAERAFPSRLTDPTSAATRSCNLGPRSGLAASASPRQTREGCKRRGTTSQTPPPADGFTKERGRHAISRRSLPERKRGGYTRRGRGPRHTRRSRFCSRSSHSRFAASRHPSIASAISGPLPNERTYSSARGDLHS